ncbi:hypothetical protein [Cellulomonas sp.]|uniref:hypothetical protein n=1 Tax=Cellulomonas sp. TaxID=40001 RepID=UPI001B13456E|nr:hypothetical protein [Cellulomonas sp.]MBO9555307.1 hypothetical protein [Cellulomonas sp.]
MRTTRLARALTAALVVAAAAAGCTTAGVAAQDAPRPTRSASDPQAAHLTWEQLTPDTLVPRLSESMLAARSLTWTTRTTGPTGPVENVVDVDMVRSNNRVSATIPGGAVEVRSVDGRRFVRAPATHGKYFDDTKGDAGLPVPAVSVDPVRPVRALYGAVIAVRIAGPRTDVNGVPAQPYDVVVATSRLTDGLGDLGGGVPREQLPATVTLGFWVDQQNRLVKATSNIAGTPVEMTFTSWGADAGITAPTEDQLTNVLSGT